MGPRPDAGEAKVLFVRAVGGEVGNNPALAQKLGPLGVPPKKVQEDIAKATAEYKSLRIRVKVTVQNRVATLELAPSTSCLIIKALNEPPRDRKKQKNIKHNGDITLDKIVEIARYIRPKSMSRLLAGVVCEVAGTCNSVGCTVDGKKPKAFTAMVKAGEIEIPSV
ncbi:MAG: 60S ribosomal protein L12 [Amphiamblys sp. WSBS2006]|nr:MAG: 60S ribosomal protein L12 [Amphiamblys sp. WSBS2006]